jgi:hypothetical protein
MSAAVRAADIPRPIIDVAALRAISRLVER